MVICNLGSLPLPGYSATPFGAEAAGGAVAVLGDDELIRERLGLGASRVRARLTRAIQLGVRQHSDSLDDRRAREGSPGWTGTVHVMGVARWSFGDQVVRREFLHGHPWIGFTTYVVSDEPDLLGVYLASGSELAFPDWPFDQWQHPWHTAGHTHWSGHGKLILQRPSDAYSVDLFWSGEEREFAGWYVNLQDPIRRHGAAFDTLDHELDYWVSPVGTWNEKDGELFEQRVSEGRYSEELAAAVRAVGASVRDMLTRGEQSWDPAWAEWRPPESWQATTLPAGWDVPTEA